MFCSCYLLRSFSSRQPSRQSSNTSNQTKRGPKISIDILRYLRCPFCIILCLEGAWFGQRPGPTCIFAGLGSVQVLNRSCSSRMVAPNVIHVDFKKGTVLNKMESNGTRICKDQERPKLWLKTFLIYILQCLTTACADARSTNRFRIPASLLKKNRLPCSSWCSDLPNEACGSVRVPKIVSKASADSLVCFQWKGQSTGS